MGVLSSLSRLAIVGLVLSCLGIPLGLFACVPGLVCGYIARRQIQRSGGILTGENVARVSIVVGWVVLVLNIVLGIAAILYVRSLFPR